MKQLLRSKGFTLIELVMVIVILGILAAVAVPKFADISGKANIAVFNGDITQVNGGIQIQRAANLIADPSTRGYPIDLDGLGNGETVDVFINVLEGGIDDGRWSKGGTALPSLGTFEGDKKVIYNFVKSNPDTLATYDNFLGIIK